MMRRILGPVFWLAFVSVAYGQDAVPIEILQRTKLIRVGDSAGTAFSLDYQGKLYLVTAKHVVIGLPPGKTNLQIWQSDKWQDMPIMRTLFPSSSNVDVAVLETDERVSQPFSISVIDQTGGVTLGQQVWFLGYPFADVALTSHFQDQVFPFIKRGTISAIDGRKADSVVMYIDGFNNPGFSGGPILFWDFKQHVYKILAVVQGYRNDIARAMINGKQVDTNILVNSGIIVGYSVKHAIEAIESQK